MVARINSRSGLDSVTLFDESHFVRAHQSLARYINDGTSNVFTLTPAMFDDLTQRSPALAHLADGFRNWQLSGGIVYVDALRFALADGLALTGDLPDASRRDHALDALSHEIDALCTADHRPACGAFAGPPPIPVVRFGDVMHAAVRPFTGLRQVLMVEGPPPAVAGDDGSAQLLHDWERATNTSPPSGSYVVDGDTVHFTAPTTTVSSVFVSIYLAIGRVLSPITRVLGIVAAVFLVRRRQWRPLALGGALLLCAYLRAAEVALAEHFLIGDYDFHYVQPAATLVHVTALIWLGVAGQRAAADSQRRATSAVTEPRIAICVPAYAAERFLAEALDSALAQTETELGDGHHRRRLRRRHLRDRPAVCRGGYADTREPQSAEPRRSGNVGRHGGSNERAVREAVVQRRRDAHRLSGAAAGRVRGRHARTHRDGGCSATTRCRGRDRHPQAARDDGHRRPPRPPSAIASSSRRCCVEAPTRSVSRRRCCSAAMR